MSLSIEQILLGIPCLTTLVGQQDVVLFSHDENFSQIIPNGKQFYMEYSEFVAANGHDLIIETENTWCQRFAEYQSVLKPTLSQSLESLKAAQFAGLSPLVEAIRQHPTNINNYQLHAILLQRAVKENKLHQVDLLLTESVLNRHRDWYQRIALQLAVTGSHNELAKHLVFASRQGNNLKVLFDGLCTALSKGNHDLATYFLQLPQLRERALTNSPLLINALAEGGSVQLFDVLDKILDFSTSIAANNNSVLKIACARGHTEFVDKLLTYPTVIENLTDPQNEAFMNACVNGHIAIANKLLTIPAVMLNITARDYKVIQMSCFKGQLAIVQVLLTMPSIMQGVKTWRTGAFDKACRSGNLALVQTLFAIPELHDDLEINFDTFLLTCQNGHFHVAKYLLTLPTIKKQITIRSNSIFRSIIEIMNKDNMSFDDEALDTLTEAYPSDHRIIGIIELIEALLLIPEVKKAFINNPHLIFVQLEHNSQLAIALNLIKHFSNNQNLKVYIMRMACAENNITVLREMLAVDVVREQVANLDNKAFMMACRGGHLTIVNELLTFPTVMAAINATDNYNNGEALDRACQSGQIGLVRKLLSLPAFYNIVAENDNVIFKNACYSGDIAVVTELLQIPHVQALAAPRGCEALLKACKKGSHELVNLLLTLPAMKSALPLLGSQLLIKSIQSCDLDLVSEILALPEVFVHVSSDRNAALITAIRYEFTPVIQELLKYPQVIAGLAYHHNLELNIAMDMKNIDIISRLLKEQTVCQQLTFKQLLALFSIPDIELPELNLTDIFARECLSKTELLELFVKLDCQSNRKLQAIFCQYLDYYHYDNVPTHLADENCATAILSSIEGSFNDYFKDPKTHAAALLQAQAEAAYLYKTKKTYEDLADDGESAMDASLVSDAINRFTYKVKPEHQVPFRTMGGIVGIETAIYAALLDRKVLQLKQQATAESISQIEFIAQNRAALTQREESVLAVVRHYFTSNNDTLDIALRAFDSKAPTHGWEKLFVAPSKEKEDSIAFSTQAANHSELKLKQASDICREMLCYAFLLTQDTSLAIEIRDDLLETFILYLAEISRAHNEGSAKTDNPSCFPGTLSRLDLIFQRHPNYHVDISLFHAVNDIASQLLIKAFDQALQQLTSVTDKLALYEAITLIDHTNAQVILCPKLPVKIRNTSGKRINLNEMIRLRKQFFEQCFGENGRLGIQKIKDSLFSRYQMHLSEDEEIIAHLPLLNMSKATPSTTFSLTKAYQLACPMVIEQPLRINPFKQDYHKIYHLLVMFPETRREQLAVAKFTEASIKAAYFEMSIEATPEQIEEHYYALQEKLHKSCPDQSEFTWKEYNAIIKAICTHLQCAQQHFPTRESIQQAIAYAKEKRKQIAEQCIIEDSEQSSSLITIQFNQLVLNENATIPESSQPSPIIIPKQTMTL